MDTGIGDDMAAQTVPHLRYLRHSLPGLCVLAELDYRPSLAGRGRADHGADVSVVRLLYDHRPEDDRECEMGTELGRVLRGAGRDGSAPGGGSPCAFLRALPGGTRSVPDRDVVELAQADRLT